jgi:hypothetical protein
MFTTQKDSRGVGSGKSLGGQQLNNFCGPRPHVPALALQGMYGMCSERESNGQLISVYANKECLPSLS